MAVTRNKSHSFLRPFLTDLYPLFISFCPKCDWSRLSVGGLIVCLQNIAHLTWIHTERLSALLSAFLPSSYENFGFCSPSNPESHILSNAASHRWTPPRPYLSLERIPVTFSPLLGILLPNSKITRPMRCKRFLKPVQYECCIGLCPPTQSFVNVLTNSPSLEFLPLVPLIWDWIAKSQILELLDSSGLSVSHMTKLPMGTIISGFSVAMNLG
jgi:hypothetical protein